MTLTGLLFAEVTEEFRFNSSQKKAIFSSEYQEDVGSLLTTFNSSLLITKIKLFLILSQLEEVEEPNSKQILPLGSGLLRSMYGAKIT